MIFLYTNAFDFQHMIDNKIVNLAAMSENPMVFNIHNMDYSNSRTLLTYYSTTILIITTLKKKR